MIQINPLKSYIDGGVRAALTTPPSASLVFDLPGKAIWVKGVKLKGTDHTYIFNHDNYITLTNTPDKNNPESEDIKIGVNITTLKNVIDTTYSGGTLALLQEGLNTEERTWLAKILHNYINDVLPITKNLQINGTNYAIYTTENSLPLFFVPTSLGTTGQILACTSSGLSWINLIQNTDYRVSLSSATSNSDYRIILKQGADNNPETDFVRFSEYLTFNPYTKTLKINNIKVVTATDIYVGSTAGLVPATTSAQLNYYLRGDGAWVNIATEMAAANTWRPIKVENTDALGSGTSTGTLSFIAGTGITLAWDATNKRIIITNSSPDINHNTDENVRQVPKTDNVNRPLMMINGSTSAGEQINTSMFSTGIYANASTKMITANGFIKAGSSDSYVLLGGGGHKSISSIINGGYIGTTLVQTSSKILALSGISSINGRLSISAESDLTRLGFGGVHNVVFGEPGYAHRNYIFRPSYGSNGVTYTSLVIQNASAAASPTFTTSHSFDSNGNAYHSGKVGIGTSSPSYKLHVAGDIYTTTGFKKNGSSDSYVLLGGGGHYSLNNILHGDSYGTMEGTISDCNSVSVTGIYSSSGFANRPSGVTNWGSLFNIRLYNSNNLYHRLLFFDCYASNRIWTRSNNGGSWTSWKELITSANISSLSVKYATSAGSVAWGNVTGKPSTFTPSSHTHSYLPLSGGTMTGPIKFSYNNNGNCNVSRTSGFSMFYGNQENATNYGFPFRYSSVISFMTEYCGMQFANYGGTGDTRLLFRNISGDNTWTNWYHILHSGNSSVTKSGQTITVTINGTSQSLTNSTYNFSGASFTSGNYNTAEHNANNITSNGVWYYTSNGPTTSLGASTNDGALYSQAYNTNWVGQIALDYRNGNLFVRGKNNGTWQAWRGICWSDNYALRFHYSNLSNSPTYLWATNSNGYSFLAARGSISVNYANSAGSASTVTVNSSDANSTYRMVWHSGNTLYGTNNIYCNPNSDQIYSAGFRHVSYNSASYLLRSDGGAAAFNWSGQGGQPTWLWGGNSQHTYYVYNPSNFNVNSAAKLRVVSCYNGTTNNDLWSTIKSSNSSYLGTSTMYEVYNDGGPTTYGHILDTVTVHSNHWQSQLWMAAGKGGRLYYRNKDYNNDTWGSWGTVAWTSDIPTVTNYYWANVKVSASSSTGTSPTFQECYANGWFRSTGNNGWYNPTHGSHIHPNGTTTYGNLVVRGAKSGYTGINLGNSTSHMTVMSTDTHHGLYCDKYGWEFYFNRSNGGVGIRTSSITKNFNVSGQSYLSSNVWIGTTSGGEMLNVGGWVGTVGNNGWYSITHAGGWYMTDANWIRTYNKKGIYTDIGTIYNLGHAWFAYYSGYNVGIGTTSPSYKLHVVGDSYTTGWNRAGSGFYCQAYGTHYYGNANKDAIIYTETLNVINFETTNTSGRFWINYRAPISGHSAVNQFHFGASTGGGYGTLYALHYYESSDIRYKHNITTLNITSEKLSTLPLFNFVWDQTKGLPGWHTGTSAQEVVKILPNIISGDDSFLTLDYGVLGTIAGITACKELVTLKSELQELKEKIKLLEDKLRKYENTL